MSVNQPMNKITVSVRNLVEFVMKNGDLSGGFTGSSRTLEGIKAHQIVQKSSSEDYTPEVPLALTTEIEGVLFQISGRADGVIKRESGIVIDEIKTTTQSLALIEEDSNVLHWAQVKCYAYIYCIQNNCESIGVQLTYVHLDTREKKHFCQVLARTELQTFFEKLLFSYSEWARLIQNWEEIRNRSIELLDFPFPAYRPGQRELAGGVYKTVREGHKLFIQAPTGIGKTTATLFPALKALAEQHTSKIFYLTAKTITRTIAEGALDQMRQLNLRVKSVTLTAKDKVCLQPGAACRAEECQYAKGYYDRVRRATEHIFQHDVWNRPVIEEYARKFTVCPFEFSLDLSGWADVVICDYNYVFDPRVFLKRFFADGRGDFTFLIDEAHNLLDRAREMFSAHLGKQRFLELRKATKVSLPAISKSLTKINTCLIEFRKESQAEGRSSLVQKEPPKKLYPLLRHFTRLAEEYLVQNQPVPLREDLLELYFETSAFLRIAEFYDDKYVCYYETVDQDFRVKLFCLDPSRLLNEGMQRGKAAILFSATLSPLEYFIQSLGGDEDSYKLRLASPFARENLCLLIEDKISTSYRRRTNTYGQVAEVIDHLIQAKTGNYLVFFPSYQYQREVQNRFLEINPDVKVISQTSGMSESEREGFLSCFVPGADQSLVGFAVMGGVFGEGIDLVGDRLTGAIIVGVGLPQVCLEREIMRDYFQDKKGFGFEYAYVYPGINKVLQAAGRVIRTENDRGVVLLIDERFGHSGYKRLFPAEWQPVKVKNKQWLLTKLTEFWHS